MSVPAQPQLLEREAELGAIRALIAASTTAGRLVAVEGPAGIGKTRLIAEARAGARKAGMEVLAARGSELEREFSYGVARQLFEPLLGGAAEHERAELLSGAAGAVAPLFDRFQPQVEPGDDPSFSVLHGLLWLTANIAARRPVLLAIDDLHWCDPPSLRWLAYLVPRIEAMPVLVVAGLRPAELGAGSVLLAHLAGDPNTMLVRPAPLSELASGQVMQDLLGQEVQPEFAAACHRESGGNPLLVRELARAVAGESLAPTLDNVPRMRELGGRAVARVVLVRLAGLSPDARRLAAAAAVLDDDADVRTAAAMAELDEARVSAAADELARVDILRPPMPIGFVHPVVRSAVYAALSTVDRETAHRRAARLLADMGAEPERVAAHLLLVTPTGSSWTADTLREVGRRALARGAPDSAVVYLRRALAEPPDARRRVDVLFDLGSAEMLLNGPAAAGHLAEALGLMKDARIRASTAAVLGRSLFFSARAEEAVRVYSRAIDELAHAYPALRRELEAGIVNAGIMEPALQPLVCERLAPARDTPPEDDLGAKMMLGLLAYHDARAGGSRQAAVDRARSALAGDVLLVADNGNGPFVLSVLVLATADLDEALVACEASLARAHERGSVFAYAGGKVFRGRTLFLRGALPEAEADLRDALDPIESWGFLFGSLWATAYLADALVEQGKLAQAAEVLQRAEPHPGGVPDNAHAHWFLDSRARLRLARGELRQALDDTLDLGRRFEAVNGRNPALIAWRSQAAIALLQLGEREQARRLAGDELASAREWAAPRAVGQALRVAGLVEGGAAGLVLLREAVDVLESSPARLEHAKALTELGAALRRSNHRSEARDPLRRGLELATICGAAPLLQRAQTELLATGARPRRVALSGVASLSPSERRVAELAARGRTNREIAQVLFVTPKTVEVHLSSTYRKLEISGRSQLAGALDEPAAARTLGRPAAGPA